MRLICACAALAGLLVFSGCADLRAGVYRSYPENTFPELETWAVLGFDNESGSVHAPDGQTAEVEFTHLFAVELAKFKGVRVIHPERTLMEASRLNLRIDPQKGVEEVLKLGRALKADAVVLGTITTYNAFPPPRMGVALQVFRTKSRSVGASDIERLVQSGKPIAIERGKEGYVAASFEKVYDAHHDTTRWALQGFAKAHSQNDFGGNDFEWSAMYVRPIWFEFVATSLIREIMKTGQEIKDKTPPPAKEPAPSAQAQTDSKTPAF